MPPKTKKMSKSEREDYPEAAPSYVKPKEVSPMQDKKRTRSQKKEESAPLSKEEGECN